MVLSTCPQSARVGPVLGSPHQKKPPKSKPERKALLALMINIHGGLSPFLTPRVSRSKQSLQASDSNPSLGPLQPGMHGCPREAEQGREVGLLSPHLAPLSPSYQPCTVTRAPGGLSSPLLIPVPPRRSPPSPHTAHGCPDRHLAFPPDKP